ncbi:terpenoid synthase [Punctularia strigosozonata HHB-11173 SS5]|uniref:terpenoid synthase n=1 Tax=Punctularia strigosozonata (strain HHB-11173) TaxID=741275 RepID=UPI0004416D45|nr:terpenoid synthase [Punctularia strigosozonata HHB-11173 SS5]EIN07076.1 terpenoid synthase [Punctularia strigosozonata HHB-11173 SS5]
MPHHISTAAKSTSLRPAADVLSVGDTNDTVDIDEVRATIRAFLARCQIPYSKMAYDQEFDRLTREDLTRRRCPLAGPHSVAPYIPLSVWIARTSYGHTPHETQLFVCVFTVLASYLDDTYSDDTTELNDFNTRFVRGQEQRDPTLQSMDELIREIPQRYGFFASNVIVNSILNLPTALLLESRTKGMSIRSGAVRYPYWARVMSGVSEAYALFAFPPEMPFTDFVQAIPEIVVFINCANDVLSFYKEVLAGESTNYVSVEARLHRISKIESLRRIADETATSHERSQQMLEACPKALEAYMALSHGYVAFHACSERYRLNEAGL